VGRKLVADSTSHLVLVVALGVNHGRLEAAVSRVTREPGEALDAAFARAVDVDAFGHVEQLETRVLRDGTLATAYLGLTREPRGDPPATDDERELVETARARLRAKLSYTNVGFALAPDTFTISELRDVYVAALGYDVSATNLQRVLLRRGVLAQVDGVRAPGRAGGRPAALFEFSERRLAITDEFAALRPPGSRASG
jgi:ADP-ribose pyrophosphatase YjhB (NUDIX family)